MNNVKNSRYRVNLQDSEGRITVIEGEGTEGDPLITAGTIFANGLRVVKVENLSTGRYSRA